jgi:hypothetical protein
VSIVPYYYKKFEDKKKLYYENEGALCEISVIEPSIKQNKL